MYVIAPSFLSLGIIGYSIKSEAKLLSFQLEHHSSDTLWRALLAEKRRATTLTARRILHKIAQGVIGVSGCIYRGMN